MTCWSQPCSLKVWGKETHRRQSWPAARPSQTDCELWTTAELAGQGSAGETATPDMLACTPSAWRQVCLCPSCELPSEPPPPGAAPLYHMSCRQQD